jgi:hypothetical protein
MCVCSSVCICVCVLYMCDEHTHTYMLICAYTNLQAKKRYRILKAHRHHHENTHTHTYTYICIIYIYIHTHTYIYIYIYTYIRTCAYTNLQAKNDVEFSRHMDIITKKRAERKNRRAVKREEVLKIYEDSMAEMVEAVEQTSSLKGSRSVCMCVLYMCVYVYI